MTDRNLDDLHPDLKPLCQQWLDKCHAQQINARVIETYRSAQEQDRLFAIGRDANGNIIGRTFTKARGGQSKHNITLPDGTPASKAFDFTIISDDGTCNWNPESPPWKAAVAIGKVLGLVWGGDFPANQMDCDHFQID
jgi:peptidoglycan L-alanyl-D-glutamate endopeptidase CwlK